MRTDFLCPKCSNILNVGENVVFSTKNKRKKEGLILLHPELGNYSLIKHSNFDIQDGEIIDFYCPYCGEMLKSEKHENLAKILIRDENGNEGEVHFSRIAGQHATYKITGQNMEIYGNDATDYYDFIMNSNF
jgi:predicted RNA-binding Zn-ribbon protein involved in translation (DUF1610 family)